MARLTIPESLRTPLTSVASMEQEAFNALVNSLRNVVPSMNPTTIVSRIEENASDSLPKIDLSGVVGALYSLYQIRDVNEVALSEFVDDLGDAMSVAARPTPIDLQAFKQRITILLDIPSVAISAKAFSLQREQPKTFISARVLSDVRPVFSEDPDILKAAMVVHQLKISYAEDDERHELFVTLDNDDLVGLQKAITRAQAKAKALAALIGKTDLIGLG